MKSVGGILEIQPGAHVYETTVPLTAGQTVEYGLLGLPVPQVDAEGKTGSYRYPPLPPEGQPGVAFQWIEIEGPIPPPMWPPPSHRVLFDDLGVSPTPAQPKREASRLLRRFLQLGGARPGAGGSGAADSSNWCLPASTATSLSPKRCWPVIRPSCARICSSTCASRMTTSPSPTGFRTF